MYIVLKIQFGKIRHCHGHSDPQMPASGPVNYTAIQTWLIFNTIYSNIGTRSYTYVFTHKHIGTNSFMYVFAHKYNSASNDAKVCYC